MKQAKIILFAVLALCLNAGQSYAQNKKPLKRVAVMDVLNKRGDISDGVKIMVRSYMTEAVTMTLGYEGYDRVDIGSIMSELEFQQSGLVNPEHIQKIGTLSGAQFVMVVELSKLDEANLTFSGKVLDVETGRVVNSGYVNSANNSASYEGACKQLASKMFGGFTFMSGSNQYHQAPAQPTPAPAPTPKAEPVPAPAPKPAPAQQVSDGSDYIENAADLDMKMVFVKGGTFTMGCTPEQQGCSKDETVTREIFLESYCISATEITWYQWHQIMDDVPNSEKYAHYNSAFDKGREQYPIYNITWEEAMKFCNKLSERTGKDYTLPTEAQWEYAARGGVKSKGYQFSGNNSLGMAGWAQENSGGEVHPVKGLRPNELGIYDMSGNVAEMCSDWYAKEYNAAETSNPVGPSFGSNHVVRGGAWNVYGNECRVSKRAQINATEKNTSLGFRVVMIP